MTIDSRYDVVVVGGGPAGSTVAGLVAKAGFSVALFESAHFPRFHIGESLISGMFPVLERLGVREAADARGFQRKDGLSLVWGSELAKWDINFAETGFQPYSFHVDRADFDELLLRHAQGLGVAVHEGCRTLEPLTSDGRVSGVRVQTSEGPRDVAARFVVDASGQSRVIARKMTGREWNESLNNIAVWGYWTSDKALEEGAHHTLVERCTDRNGWFWSIPLCGDRVSVGCVLPSNGAHGQSPDYYERLSQTTWTRELTGKLTAPTQLRNCRDHSYRSHQWAGPGWAAVGDAGAFIDPLLSTGVCLAMLEAEPLGELIAQMLRGERTEDDLVSLYDEGCQGFIGAMTDYVEYFYDSTRDYEDYEARAQSLVTEANTRSTQENFTRVLSGVIGAGRVIDI